MTDLERFDIERAVLGCILIDHSVMPYVYDKINPIDMKDSTHQLIYTTMMFMWAMDCPIDQVSLTEVLSCVGKLDEAGGPAYIAELAGDMCTTVGIGEFVEKLKNGE